MVGKADDLNAIGMREAVSNMHGETSAGSDVVSVRAVIVAWGDALRNSLSVEPRAIEKLPGRVLRRSKEIEPACVGIDGGDGHDVPIKFGNQLGLTRFSVDAIGVPPAVAFADPKQIWIFDAGLADPMKRAGLYPRLILIFKKDFCFAGRSIGQHQQIGVLQAIEIFKDYFTGVTGPTHLRDIVLTRVTVEPDPTSGAAGGINSAGAHGGVGRSGLRIFVFDDRRVFCSGVIDQRVFADTGLVKLPVSDGLAIGAPAKAIAEGEFLFAHPVGRSE